MKKLAIIATATALLAACATGSYKPNPACGTFEGTFTTANGENVISTLQLNRNNSFNSILIYQNQPDNIFTEQGTYSLSGDKVKITPLNGEPAYYKVKKDALHRLNQQKHLITNTLADSYTLRRISCCK